MPIYEYRCNECKHEVEALQKLSDPPLMTCPACGKDALVKLVSAAGFQLKGSGWYVTDFRGGSGGTKPGKTDAPAEAAKSETKTEGASKSDAATPASTPSTTTTSGSSGSSES